MPYIPSTARENLKVNVPSNSPGTLNYTITKLCHNYIIQQGLSYAIVNEVIGVLECAKLELYRIVIAPYENKKQKENGNISDLDVQENRNE